MRNFSQEPRNVKDDGSEGRPNRLGVLVLGLLTLAAILSLLFVPPREAAGVVRLA